MDTVSDETERRDTVVWHSIELILSRNNSNNTRDAHRFFYTIDHNAAHSIVSNTGERASYPY